MGSSNSDGYCPLRPQKFHLRAGKQAFLHQKHSSGPILSQFLLWICNGGGLLGLFWAIFSHQVRQWSHIWADFTSVISFKELFSLVLSALTRTLSCQKALPIHFKILYIWKIKKNKDNIPSQRLRIPLLKEDSNVTSKLEQKLTKN